MAVVKRSIPRQQRSAKFPIVRYVLLPVMNVYSEVLLYLHQVCTYTAVNARPTPTTLHCCPSGFKEGASRRCAAFRTHGGLHQADGTIELAQLLRDRVRRFCADGSGSRRRTAGQRWALFGVTPCHPYCRVRPLRWGFVCPSPNQTSSRSNSKAGLYVLPPII